MAKLGLLVDYEYCTGCHSCEMACQHQLGLPSDKWGIKMTEVEPFEYAERKWEWDYVPVPTNLCDMCEERVEKGLKPMCVQTCLAFCLDYGTPEELLKKLEEKGSKVAIFLP